MGTRHVPDLLTPVSGLLDEVGRGLPDGRHVVLDTTVGQEISVGTVGTAGSG